MRKIFHKFKKWYGKHPRRNFNILLTILILLVLFLPSPSELSTHKIPYNKFIQQLEDGKVETAIINFNDPEFIFTDTNDKKYITDNPKTETFKETLLKNGVKVKESSNNFNEILLELFKLGLWIAFFFFIYNKILNSDTKVSINTVKNIPDVSFKNIAGIDEIKEDMKYLVDFLKNPKKYEKMGAKLPKGVILYGQPGTGKTLTAKAIAGEAGVPFYAMSGSDFVELYVGMGARKVRKLFEEARKNAPCIIFIDEIDSLGGNRDNGGMHSEDRKTINAILNELDGFSQREGIVVIGATNRLSDLDPAFIRPGRFDKLIAIPLPDQKGRLEILKIHAEGKPLANEVSLEEMAKTTIGFSGAQLESLLNEASIIATTREHEKITPKDIDDAYYKILVKGHAKKSGDKRDEEEIKLVAWHEASHALTAKLITDNEVPKVTITPSTTGAGGITFITPNKMRLYSKEEILNNIKVLYAGRAGEYLLLRDENKITSGASNDIEQATKELLLYVGKYGMSETFGMVSLSAITGNNFKMINNKEFLEEITHLSKKLYKETVQLLLKHVNLVETIANKLIENETISGEELDKMIQDYFQIEKSESLNA